MACVSQQNACNHAVHITICWCTAGWCWPVVVQHKIFCTAGYKSARVVADSNFGNADKLDYAGGVQTASAPKSGEDKQAARQGPQDQPTPTSFGGTKGDPSPPPSLTANMEAETDKKSETPAVQSLVEGEPNDT